MVFTAKINIPKTFKSKDKTLLIELKSEMSGRYDVTDEGDAVFNCSFPVFSLPIVNDYKNTIVKELKEKIIEIYIKGIKDVKSLTAPELSVFYHIKDVKSNEIMDHKTLLIGYEDNLLDLKNVILKFNTTCECYKLEKNIELYLGEYNEKIYKPIKNKIKHGNYDGYIIDMANVYLPTDYSNTKKIIELIESNNGKILFLLDHYDTAKERFIKIFGDKYENCVIDKRKYLNPDQNFVLYKIDNILFK